jgi:hypothetical protein
MSEMVREAPPQKIENLPPNPQPEPRSSRGTRGLTGAVLLIVLGGALLLNNMGMVTVNWLGLLRFWPVILILVGVDLLLGARSVIGGMAIALLAVVVLGALVFWTSRDMPTNFNAVIHPIDAGTLAGAETLTLEMNVGAGEIVVRGADGLGSPVFGTFEGPEWINVTTTGEVRASRASVELNVRTPEGEEWQYIGRGDFESALDVSLANDLPLTLILNAGAGDLSLDLSDTLLQSLEINAGAGEISVILPASGDIRIDLNMGAGSIAFTIPETLEASLNVEGLVVNVSVPDDFNETGFHSYQTAGYGSGAEKATIFINGAAGEVRVTR